LEINVWWLSFHHFHGHNPETPGIDFEVVGLPFADFWCHPIWCSDECFEVGYTILTETEVGFEVLA
jgi:hypothetical protein